MVVLAEDRWSPAGSLSLRARARSPSARDFGGSRGSLPCSTFCPSVTRRLSRCPLCRAITSTTGCVPMTVTRAVMVSGYLITMLSSSTTTSTLASTVVPDRTSQCGGASHEFVHLGAECGRRRSTSGMLDRAIEDDAELRRGGVIVKIRTGHGSVLQRQETDTPAFGVPPRRGGSGERMP